MCPASEADGLPSWLSCSAAVPGRDDGSARVAMLTGAARGGDVPTSTASTAELGLLYSECSEEQRSCESECSARGDTKSVSGAATPSFARSDSGMVMLALDGASAGL